MRRSRKLGEFEKPLHRQNLTFPRPACLANFVRTIKLRTCSFPSMSLRFHVSCPACGWHAVMLTRPGGPLPCQPLCVPPARPCPPGPGGLQYQSQSVSHDPRRTHSSFLPSPQPPSPSPPTAQTAAWVFVLASIGLPSYPPRERCEGLEAPTPGAAKSYYIYRGRSDGAFEAAIIGLSRTYVSTVSRVSQALNALPMQRN